VSLKVPKKAYKSEIKEKIEL